MTTTEAKQYCVVRTDRFQHFEALIQNKLDAGWKLFGFTQINGTLNHTYWQAMVHTSSTEEVAQEEIYREQQLQNKNRWTWGEKHMEDDPSSRYHF